MDNDDVDMRTYLDVPFDEKDEAKKLGARWDKFERKWFIPPNVPTEKFEEYSRWFSEGIWSDAPLCPKETDPFLWGKMLFGQLKAWAVKWKLGPASLVYWDINFGTPPLEKWQDTNQVVQVVWPRGPYCWSIILLRGRSYNDWGPSKDGVHYFLQPNNSWSFAIDSVKL